jgi:hypothetical protein
MAYYSDEFTEEGFEDVDQIYPAQDRVLWRAFVNTVTNPHIP